MATSLWLIEAVRSNVAFIFLDCADSLGVRLCSKAQRHIMATLAGWRLGIEVTVIAKVACLTWTLSRSEVLHSVTVTNSVDVFFFLSFFIKQGRKT